ncbi:hypothetical protein HDU93_007260, partial [Gonapodya sp. JEL0774]
MPPQVPDTVLIQELGKSNPALADYLETVRRLGVETTRLRGENARLLSENSAMKLEHENLTSLVATTSESLTDAFTRITALEAEVGRLQSLLDWERAQNEEARLELIRAETLAMILKERGAVYPESDKRRDADGEVSQKAPSPTKRFGFDNLGLKLGVSSVLDPSSISPTSPVRAISHKSALSIAPSAENLGQSADGTLTNGGSSHGRGVEKENVVSSETSGEIVESSKLSVDGVPSAAEAVDLVENHTSAPDEPSPVPTPLLDSDYRDRTPSIGLTSGSVEAAGSLSLAVDGKSQVHTDWGIQILDALSSNSSMLTAPIESGPRKIERAISSSSSTSHSILGTTDTGTTTTIFTSKSDSSTLVSNLESAEETLRESGAGLLTAYLPSRHRVMSSSSSDRGPAESPRSTFVSGSPSKTLKE